VSDDHATQGAGKIDPDAARRVISRVHPNADGIGWCLAGCRVGGFAGGHGHDLLPHDHEAIIDDAHHHDEENGQDEGKLNEGLAFAPPTHCAKSLEVRKSLHCSSA